MNIYDQLPVYPTNIQGELRLILQNKDLFLLCYKHLEEYRKLFEEQNRIITKDFVEEQIRMGEDEVKELSRELTISETKLQARLQQNETLLGQLSIRGMSSLGEIGKRNICRSPAIRKCAVINVDRDFNPYDSSLFENIALAIEEIQKEIKDKLKPLCDFYRDLFYLQLHFTLVLTQVCNYCMPLVTENIGLIDRIFFWADRPEFELIRKSGEIADRLKDIYTRTQSVLTLLIENVMFLQNKVELQKNLEKKFQERIELQQFEKDRILRKIHLARQDLDGIDEENDRLVGILVKLDPKYVGTEQFNKFAEYSVRRNYLEGRLTPDGYHNRQTTLSPSKRNESTKAETQYLSPNYNRTQTQEQHSNENASNIETKTSERFEKFKNNRSQFTATIDMKKENINPQLQNRQRVKKKVDKLKRNSNNLLSIDSKASIKDKLMSRTKNIFEGAVKKTSKPQNRKSNNYVKVFEGEILAELSQFSTMDSNANNTNHSTSPFSMEKSLKRKFDAKEAELFSPQISNWITKSFKTKTNTKSNDIYLSDDRTKLNI